MLALLLLLSLLAIAWQGAHLTHSTRVSGIGATTVSAPVEQPGGGDSRSEPEQPAKLRRQTSAHASPLLQGGGGDVQHALLLATAAPPRAFSLIPSAPHTAPQALPSPRLQRGQAPPLA